MMPVTVPWSGIYGPGHGRPTYINCSQPTATGYRLAREPATLAEATSAVDHAVFAEAAADEVTSPTVHQGRALVTPGDVTGMAARS